MNRQRWLLVAVVAVGLLAYANTLKNGAVLDGQQVLETARAVRDPTAVLEILRSPYVLSDDDRTQNGRTNVPGGYRPLTVWTLAVGYGLNEAVGQPGPAPFVHHLGNVLAFGALCGVLVVFLRRTLRAPTAAVAFASLVYAVHPIHTEAVAGIVGRAEILAALFGLGLIVAHRAGWNPILCALLYMAALLSKESAVGFAAVAVAWDLLRPTPAGERWRPWHFAAYVAVALVWWFGLRASAMGGAAVVGDAGLVANPMATQGALERLNTAFAIQLDYLRLLAFPLELSADYSYAEVEPLSSPWDPRVLGFVAIFTAAVALAWRCRTRRPRVSLAVLGYAALFAPTSNILLSIGTCQAERLLFAPSLFACLLAGEALHSASRARPAAGRWLRVVAVVVLGLLLLRTLVRNHVWEGREPFMEARLRDAPRSGKAHLVAGDDAYRAGKVKEALRLYQIGSEVIPGKHQTLAIARCHMDLGEYEEALRLYEPLLIEDPKALDVGERLVRALLLLGRARDAASVVGRLEAARPDASPMNHLRGAVAQAFREQDSKRYPGLPLAHEEPLERMLAGAGTPAFEQQLQHLYRSGEFSSLLILTHVFLALRWDPRLAPRQPRDYRMPRLLAWYLLERKVASAEHLRLTEACLRTEGKPEAARARRALLDWTLEHRDALQTEPGPSGATVFRLPPSEDTSKPSSRFPGLREREAKLLSSVQGARGAALFDAWLGEVSESRDPRSLLVLTHLVAALPWQAKLAPRAPDDDRMRKVRAWLALDAAVADDAFRELSQRYRQTLDDASQQGAARDDLLDWLTERLARLEPGMDPKGQRVFRLKSS